MTKPVVIYSKDHCPYCVNAKKFFTERNISFTEHNLQTKPEEMIALSDRTKHRTMPQIFIGETFVGGFTDLVALDQAGKLQSLLKD
jgi:glutaredoxin 3